MARKTKTSLSDQHQHYVFPITSAKNYSQVSPKRPIEEVQPVSESLSLPLERVVLARLAAILDIGYDPLIKIISHPSFPYLVKETVTVNDTFGMRDMEIYTLAPGKTYAALEQAVQESYAARQDKRSREVNLKDLRERHGLPLERFHRFLYYGLEQFFEREEASGKARLREGIHREEVEDIFTKLEHAFLLRQSQIQTGIEKRYKPLLSRSPELIEQYLDIVIQNGRDVVYTYKPGKSAEGLNKELRKIYRERYPHRSIPRKKKKSPVRLSNISSDASSKPVNTPSDSLSTSVNQSSVRVSKLSKASDVPYRASSDGSSSDSYSSDKSLPDCSSSDSPSSDSPSPQQSPKVIRSDDLLAMLQAHLQEEDSLDNDISPGGQSRENRLGEKRRKDKRKTR